MSAGQVAVLNVGDGDTKLTFSSDNPAEVARASKVVTDMLARGYALLVQVGEKDGEPLYQRARGFDPATNEYIIASAGEEVEVEIGKPASKRRGRPRSKRLKASETSAVSVGRTSGG